jgi:hypothetical protein
MEGQELEDYYAESAKSIFAENQKKAELEAKAAEKASLLDRLGITEDEAKLLLA